jgi:hypothetical protein
LRGRYGTPVDSSLSKLGGVAQALLPVPTAGSPGHEQRQKCLCYGWRVMPEPRQECLCYDRGGRERYPACSRMAKSPGFQACAMM